MREARPEACFYALSNALVSVTQMPECLLAQKPTKHPHDPTRDVEMEGKQGVAVKKSSQEMQPDPHSGSSSNLDAGDRWRLS